jgi:hypothetical protein
MTDNNKPSDNPEDDLFDESLDDLALLDDLTLEELEELEALEFFEDGQNFPYEETSQTPAQEFVTPPAADPIFEPAEELPHEPTAEPISSIVLEDDAPPLSETTTPPAPPISTRHLKGEAPAQPSRLKSIAFAAFILAVCFTASFVITIPETAKNIIAEKLAESGFRNVTIGDVSLMASAIHASDIRLDTNGFDTIQSLTAKISWPSFLLTKSVKTIEINDLVLTREGKDFRYVMQQAVSNLLKLPETRTVLKNATFDVSTAFGELRFILDATIDKPKDETTQVIQARLRAEQFQLAFDSNWTGIVTKDNKISLTSEFVDGKLRFGPLNVTRYNGWVGVETGAQSLSLQTQIDAGGASLFDVPLQQVSLIMDIGTNTQTLMFRAAMAGMPDTILSADMIMSRDNQDAQIVLKGDDLGAVLFQAEQARKSQKRLNDHLKEAGSFVLTSRYQPESRFTGGPLPFLLELTTNGQKQLSGNYLFYFGEMDVRGSIETDKKMLNALREHFDIDPKLIDGNFIRLDGSVKDMFVPD